MMYHLAQESGACPILSERHALCAGTKMRRYGTLYVSFAGDCQRLSLNACQGVVVKRLHHAIGSSHRLHSGSLRINRAHGAHRNSAQQKD